MKGIPIHGIGMQGHFQVDGFSTSSIDRNIKRFGDLGLLAIFTEVDVSIPKDKFNDSLTLNRQAENYAELMSVCLRNDNCESFVLWGFTDMHSWIPRHTKNELGQALIFNNLYEPKPAYWSLLNTLTGD